MLLLAVQAVAVLVDEQARPAKRWLKSTIPTLASTDAQEAVLSSMVREATADDGRESPLSLLQLLARGTLTGPDPPALPSQAQQRMQQLHGERLLAQLCTRLGDAQPPRQVLKALQLLRFLLLHASSTFLEQARAWTIPARGILHRDLHGALCSLLSDDAKLAQEREAAQRDPHTSITYPYPPALTRPAPIGDRPIATIAGPIDRKTIDSGLLKQLVDEAMREAAEPADNNLRGLLAHQEDVVLMTRNTDCNAQLLSAVWQWLQVSSSGSKPTLSSTLAMWAVMLAVLRYGHVTAVEQLRASRHALACAATRLRSTQYAGVIEERMWELLLLLEETTRVECMRRLPNGHDMLGELALSCVALPGNDVCADCSRQSARWAAPWLGVFLCSRCAYLHTTLTGRAKLIKHCLWEEWFQLEVDAMMAKGNAQVNAEYEAMLPAERKAKPDDTVEVVERYIRDKYEQRLFYKRDGRDERQTSEVRARTPHTRFVRHPRPRSCVLTSVGCCCC